MQHKRHWLQYILGFWGLFVSSQGWGQQVVQEEVSLALDRQTYVAGERVWFTVTCRDAFTLQPSLLSQVGIVELWNQAGQPIRQLPVQLIQGQGQANLPLPQDLNSGYYYLRAYTPWMVERGLPTTAEVPVIILQPNAPLPVVRGELAEALPQLQVDIFPAGGKWIAGIPQEVGIAIQPADIPGLKAYLIADEQDTLAQLQADASGRTSFSLPAALDQAYEVVLQGAKGNVRRFACPQPSEVGLTFSSTWQEALRQLSIRAQAIGIADGPLQVRVIKGGLVLDTHTIPLKDGQGRASLSLSDNICGDLLMTISEPEGNPLAKRYVYIPANRPPSVEAQLTPSLATPREALSLAIRVKDDAGQATPAKLVVSVSRKGINLMGDTGSHTGPLAQLCRPVTFASDTLRALPALYGPTVSGFVKDRQGQPQSQASVWVSLVDHPGELQVVQTDLAGRFQASFPGRFGLQEVMVLANASDETPLTITLDQPLAGPLQRPIPYNLTLRPEDIPLAKAAIQTYRLSEAFPQTSIQNRRSQSRSVTAPFYGEPDAVYQLDDYTRFVMEETFREIIYFVEVKGNNNKGKVLRVEDRLTGQLLIEDPLVLVDGVPIPSFQALFAMNAKEVSHIEVYRTRYQFNHLSFGGIIHLLTFRGKAAPLTLPSHYQRVVLSFPPNPTTFVPVATPLPNQATQPDFRNQLYWNPSLQTDASGEATVMIPTSDALGDYEVTIRATTHEGNTGRVVIPFRVEWGNE